MLKSPAPRLILETLLPHLKVAAAYAREIQSRIGIQPEKQDTDNLFASALTDADLSIQTFVEVTILGTFPNLRFYGEEHEQTYNTKYFRSIELGPSGDYLITLDPIDGTRFYQDGHPNYQIIVAVLNADEYEAVLAISPGQDIYYYALKENGTHWGNLHTDNLEDCQPLQVQPPEGTILVGSRLSGLSSPLSQHFDVVDVEATYSSNISIPNVNGLLQGDLTGAILATGNWIDGAALAFLAQEAGFIVSTHAGEPLPPLFNDQDRQRPGLIIAATPSVHQQLVAILNGYSLSTVDNARI